MEPNTKKWTVPSNGRVFPFTAVTTSTVDRDAMPLEEAMLTASMMRPFFTNPGPAVILSDRIQHWPSQLTAMHGGDVRSFILDDNAEVDRDSESLLPQWTNGVGTIYVSMSTPILHSSLFVFAANVALRDNGMLIFDLGVCDLGTPAYMSSRTTLQQLGERFHRVYVLTDAPGSHLIVACFLKGLLQIPDKDFYTPEDYAEEYAKSGNGTFRYVKVQCQMFHALGDIGKSYVEPAPLHEEYEATNYPYVYRSDLVSKLGGVPHLSMTYDTDHMQILWNRDKELGNHLVSFTRTVSYNDELVAVLPFYGDEFSIIKDSHNSVYMHCMLGEDILINFEPTMKPEHFIGVCKLLPPYMSMDLSVDFSDRVYRSLRFRMRNAIEVLQDEAGVCLFDYETTRIRDLPSLYSRMPRDTRKEAQRTMRNIEKNFDVAYGNSIPENDPSWNALLQNYLDHRGYMDSQLPEKERRECSIAGTLLHMEACQSASKHGMLFTVEIRSKETKALVAVNFAILHNVSQVVADVVCVRNCDQEWRKYSIGVAAILLNYDMFSRMPEARWYDLGTIGVENTYAYKKMFYTDRCLRLGVAMCSDMMLLESALPESKYVFPLLYRGPDGSCVTVNDMEQSIELVERFDTTLLSTLQKHYMAYPSHRLLRNEVIRLITHLLSKKTGA